MKKFLAILLTVLLCLLTLPVSVAADGWTEVTEASQLVSANANYRLMNDITLDSFANFGAVTCEIDLNGHTLYGPASSYCFRVAGATLTISDSSEGHTGSIVTQATDQQRSVFWLVGGVTSNVTINGGTFDGSSLTSVANAGAMCRIETPSNFIINGGTFQNFSTTNNGGVFYVLGEGAHITVNGGTFNNNTGKDGGVFFFEQNKNSTLTINGGTFTGNTSTTNGGGVVYMHTNNDFYLNGGTFTGNTAPRGGAILLQNNTVDFYLGGSPKVYGNTASIYGKDIFLANYSGGSCGSFQPSTMDLNSDAILYFSTNNEANDVVLGTLSNTNNVSNCFYDSRNNYGYRQEGNQILFGHKVNDVYYTPWASSSTLPTSTGNYFLVSNVDLIDAQVLTASCEVHLDLNGRTVTQTVANKAIYRYWQNNSSLFIEDNYDLGGVLTGCTGNNNAAVIWMNSGDATHNMYFTLNGGTISGNTGSGSGVIKIEKGIATVTINGGAITNNTCFGIYAHATNATDDVNVTINGGEISNNTVNLNGAAIRVDQGVAHITMNDGEISGNHSNAGSAINAINNADSEVIINGGEIINNTSTAANYGYAIEVDSGATLKLLGGTISGNTTTATNTRGVAKTNGTLELGGDVVVTGNTANGVARNITNVASTIQVNGTTPLTGTAQIGFGPKSEPTVGQVVTIIEGGDYTNYIASDNVNYLIKYQDGNTVFTNPSATASGNITIGENFAATIDLTLEGNYEDYIVSYSFMGEDHDVTVTSQNIEINVNDIYSFQLGKPIIVNVYYLGSLAKTINYSVKDYCEYQITHSNNADIVALCKAALNYGAASQIYFDGRTYDGGTYDTDVAHLVNADVDTTLADSSKPTNTKTVVGDLGGILEDVKCSLVLGSEVSIKVYVKTSTPLDVSQLSVSVSPSKAITDVQLETNGYYSFKITGIKVAELGNNLSMTLTDNSTSQVLTIIHSPYAFSASKWDNGDNLAELCRKLVTYGDKALACMP